jgi:tetratricopeptide (TPR) repeat protein
LQRQYEGSKQTATPERYAELREAAITAYERAVKANLRHPAIFVNLGALQLESELWKVAASNLGQAAGDNAFAPGAMHGMSIAYAKLGNSRGAAFHLIQTLRLVDVGLAMSSDEAGQLSAIYDQLLGSLDQADEQQLINMNQRFLELLTGTSWKQRVAQTRRQLDEAMKQQEPESLISMVPYINDRITEGLNRINHYVRDGMYVLAMDQAHFMLESAPDYLPIHRLIGQILLERGQIPQAMDKYNLVANTYRMRNDNEHAAEILQEAIKISPMDTELRHSLIVLLEEEGNEPGMLDQYIDMADAYYQLADTDAARSTFMSAIQLAQRINAPKEKVILILHRLGDIEVSRFDLRQALRTYEQIRKLDAMDERARRALVDLNYRLNDPVSAVRELDALLKVYAQQQKASKIVQVLEEQVAMYPSDMALRSRLAAVYRQVGDVMKSVAQLDSLAELQLTSGLHEDALLTIKRIISMNPDHVDDYKRLYQQLSGGAPHSGD